MVWSPKKGDQISKKKIFKSVKFIWTPICSTVNDTAVAVAAFFCVCQNILNKEKKMRKMNVPRERGVKLTHKKTTAAD